MKELLEKISSYNLFNCLLPGIIFSIIVTNISSYELLKDDVIVGAFFYYFIGLFISRIGSLIIEPILKKTSFIRFSDYNNYIIASQKDHKIELFSEINNMYRTLISMIFVVISLKLYELIEIKVLILETWRPYILLILFLVIFLFSYRKQTAYIHKRIQSCS